MEKEASMLQRVAKERNSSTPEIYRWSYVAHRGMRADEKRHEQKRGDEEDDNESPRVSQPARKPGREEGRKRFSHLSRHRSCCSAVLCTARIHPLARCSLPARPDQTRPDQIRRDQIR